MHQQSFAPPTPMRASLAPPPLRLEMKGLVCLAYRSCVRLQESGATNQDRSIAN